MAIATLTSTLAWAASVQSVTGSLQGGGEVVRIELSEPLTEPITGFAIQSPARIALDLPGTSNGMGQSLVEIQQGNLSTANVVEASGRTRVVLNLKTATTYRTETDGNAVLVFLDPAKQASAMQPPSSSNRRLLATSVEQTGNTVLKDVDFRRASDGAGRLVVNLGSAMVNADVRQEGKGLTIELLKTSLPEGLRRRLDVADFATPVQTITASQSNDRVRLQVDAIGDWEHSAYQSDSQFVVEVRPKKVDPSKLTSGPGFKGERLSLNFQNIEVRSLLQVIADFTNFNIVTSDTVGGSLTLRLKDVPWDQALNIIMEAKGLGMKKSGNVLWIAPKDEIDERTKRDYEAARNIEQLEPLRTQGFQINYAKAEELKKQIADNSGSGEASTRFLSGRGSAIAEPRTNQLFVTDTPSKLEEITNLLKKLDVPVRQVLIEARIVEARDTFGRSLGVKFGGGYERAGRGSVGSGYDKFGTSNSAPFVNLPAGLSTGGSAGTLALSIFNSGLTRFLSLELSAMEAEGVGKVISSPRLLTADQTQAVIEQGTEYPYTQTAPNGATTVAFKKAVLKLEVKPQITPEGNIILDLDLNKDSRGETTLQGVAIDTKHIKTQVLVENGGTVVIGGIFEMEETNQVNKVPVLGDIPVMGNLFKSRTRESTKREMLVFITPRMVTDAIARN
ncbi:MAG: type IV pilus secretin PilQ [Comamonas sp.]|uniref:type IV pilus secretin PilQ n=1 Tax=Comamonas sp. TaxID=34028 RepID=UPI002FC71BCB